MLGTWSAYLGDHKQNPVSITANCTHNNMLSAILKNSQTWNIINAVIQLITQL